MAAFLLMICLTNTGCIKTLLDKKKDNNQPDPNKYTGLWKATSAARDLNGNNIVDQNERGAVNGTSQLNMSTDGTFTYSVAPVDIPAVNFSGNWKLSDDKKSISLTDKTQGNIRFDINSDTEIQTEPIIANGQTTWLIYSH